MALENPVYAALCGPHADFALQRGRVRAYPPDVVPFLGLPPDASEADWRDAAALVTPGGAVAVIDPADRVPATWRRLRSFEVVQMVGPRAGGREDPDAVALDQNDVPAMLELVGLTAPGPFFKRTHELGRYVGFRDGDALVAMAGERLRLPGLTEISAVCTAPTHRGQGLATRLVRVLLAEIHGRGERAFLHVLTGNTTAIRLYEGLDFRARATAVIAVVSPPDINVT